MTAEAGKLRFTVHSTSGEVRPRCDACDLCAETLQLSCLQDPDYPARELLFHSPQTRGWQSPRYMLVCCCV